VLVIWAPRPTRFAELVDSRLLPGEIHGADTELTAFEDRHYGLVTSDEYASAWGWRDPVVLKRIARN
jgi:hypothetical protein